MNNFDEGFVVYWMSQFNGNHDKAGMDTPKFKPNALQFDNYGNVVKFWRKMQRLCEDGGLYRGRKVIHVSEICGYFPYKGPQ